MADPNVTNEFRCRVIVCQLNTRFVVLEDFDRTTNKLSRDALNHLNNPQQQFRDVRQRHVLSLSGTGRGRRLQHTPETD